MAAIFRFALAAVDKGEVGSSVESGGLSIALGVANWAANHAITEIPSGVRLPGLVSGINALVLRIERTHHTPGGRGA